LKLYGELGIDLRKMKPKKLFSQLFPSYFFISLIGLVVLLLITRFAFKNFYYNATTTNLTQKAHLIEEDVTKSMIKGEFKSLQGRIKEIAKKSKNRVTIILPSGKVIADSSFDIKKMENHLKRAEISEALKGEVGKSIRFSPTLKENHLYVAIPIKYKTRIIGVLRNAVSVDKLQTELYELTKKVILWSILLLILLTYFIYYQAKRISSPLEEIKKQVDVVASGNFQEKIILTEASSEEVSSLSISVQKMSETLQGQFQKINKQKNEQLAVFGSMLEGVITIYPDISIYHINKAALNLFSFQINGAIKGTPLRDVVKSERIFQMATKLLEDHKTVDNEFEYQSGRVLNVHGTILESEQTGMLGAVLVFNDITKMRELENHRKDFVANVSHELKTPLTAIQGYLETIREESLDKKTLDKFLSIINKHSMRLKSIIEDLLDLSSIEKESEVGGLKLEKQMILPLINNVVSLCSERYIKKNINIVISGEDYKVKINPPLIEQALINLIENAVKYGPEDSTVTIELQKSNSILEIRVIDRGQGIPSEHHGRLFERFYSVDKARSRELGGSGLGLSIVKHIAISHGGNVRVESEIGKSSTFIVELPLS
jgi:two-component system phosphate regulon sensor histidine kinase PhoR